MFQYNNGKNPFRIFFPLEIHFMYVYALSITFYFGNNTSTLSQYMYINKTILMKQNEAGKAKIDPEKKL